MKPFLIGPAGAAAVLAVCVSSAMAEPSTLLYDMDRFLGEPYPLAPQAAPAPPPQPAAPPRSKPAPAPKPKPVTEKRKRRRLPELALEPAPRRAPPPDEGRGVGGVLSEIRVGLLAHDQGPFSSNKEDGPDVNLEFLFVSPDLLDVIGSPRPHIGFTGNTAGDTSQAYLGLTWEWEFWRRAFAEFSLGGAVHDGELTTNMVGRTKKELGCRVLLRESVAIGYKFAGPHSVMAHLDHMSNVGICVENEGLENVGVRYGYRF